VAPPATPRQDNDAPQAKDAPQQAKDAPQASAAPQQASSSAAGPQGNSVAGQDAG
jgi:hypothetical protein